jgi:serine/threonine-protein kinase
MAEAARRLPPELPRVIAGFEILEPVGQGAMGAVYKARQVSLERVVALKVISPAVARDAQFIERFQREARASAKLNHPNVVQGIDVGRDPASGLWYFAMEYVDGRPLSLLLEEQGALTEKRALEIVRDVARALDCALRHGIVHRDVKPSNILLARTGEVKLGDLGVAKRAGDAGGAEASGKVLGTPNYMSPEQAQGREAEVDTRADLYALGATLFHLVTGQTPFSGQTPKEIMAKQVSEEPPPARQLAPHLSRACSQLIARLMQKPKELRVQTPTELIAEIDKLLGAPAVQPRRVFIGRMRDRPRLTWAVLGIGAAACVVAGAMGAIWFFGARPRDEDAPKVAQHKAPDKPAPATPPASPRPPAIKTQAEPPKPGPPRPPETKPVPAAKLPAPQPPAPPKPAPVALPAPRLVPPGPAPAPPESPGVTRPKRGFRAEYFEGQTLETPGPTREEPALDFKWTRAAPAGLTATGGASARWTGYVEPAGGGPHIFEVAVEDGARLYLDDCLLLDAWSGRPATARTLPVELEQGKKYALKLEWRSRSGRGSLCARWGLAGGELSTIAGLPPEAEGEGAPVGHLRGGWQAQYGVAGTDQASLKRREWAIACDWRSLSPAPSVAPDRFWAEWRGLVVPPATSDYTFFVDVDEGARLFVNDVLVLDAYYLRAGKYATAPLRLEEGKRYPVRLEYTERIGEALCRLSWSTPEMAECPAPAAGEGQPDAPPAKEGFLASYGQEGAEQPLLTRREAQAGWNWRGGSPGRGVPADHFWAVYTGWVQPPADAEYTFILDHEGRVSFCLDDCLLIEKRRASPGVERVGVPLLGGRFYFARVEYATRLYDAQLKFRWSGKDMPERNVAGLLPDAVHPGSRELGRMEAALLAEYGAAKEPLFRRLEARVFHDFAGGSPSPAVPSDHFWGRWTGGLQVKESGPYVFRLETENQGLGELKLNKFSLIKLARSGKGDSQPVPLQKGGTPYLFELSYSHRLYEASVKLSWRPPGKTEFEPVPVGVFLLPPEARAFPRQVPK